MLSVILSKYDNNENLEVSGFDSDFPKYMHFCIKDTIENLKLYGYLSFGEYYISGDWNVIITPDSISYFEKKGMRKELFEELPNNAKNLLKDLIECETAKEKLDNLLREKLDNDETHTIVRGVIGTLKENGLLTVSWAGSTVFYAELTNAGRTYFEREKKYMDKSEKMNQRFFSIGVLNANNSNIVFGNAINSTLNIDNTFNQIENEIEEKGGEDKEALKELLNELKEIITNFQSSGLLQHRKSFMKKLSCHLEKHGWFYGAATTILGEVAIKILMGA